MLETARLQADIEQVIDRLRSVVSSRVVIVNGTIEEIHVLADTDRPAKWIVRDIETALAAKFGIDVDHRVISIAQLAGAAGRAVAEQRLMLSSISVEMSHHGGAVQVELTLGDATYVGRMEGSRHPQERGRLAALAALNALVTVLPPQVRLHLDHLGVTQVGARRVCLASVVCCYSGREDRLLGAALVDSDLAEPAVKAVLMALNRRLGFLLRTLQPA